VVFDGVRESCKSVAGAGSGAGKRVLVANGAGSGTAATGATIADGEPGGGVARRDFRAQCRNMEFAIHRGIGFARPGEVWRDSNGLVGGGIHADTVVPGGIAVRASTCGHCCKKRIESSPQGWSGSGNGRQWPGNEPGADCAAIRPRGGAAGGSGTAGE